MDEYVTCRQMKQLEKEADAAGLSYYTMMENAGLAVADVITKKSGNTTGKKAAIFCGRGNNGGDGFVIARLLAEKNMFVTVILTDGEPVTPDAVANYRLLGDYPVKIMDIHNVESMSNPSADIIVDAVYGTGFHGKLNDEGLVAVYLMNSMRKSAKVFSVDIPSGLGGDTVTGEKIENIPVNADYTITFHRKKPIHFCRNAKDYLGEVIVADIGIDDALKKTGE